jgi:hypothetical protein
VEKTEANRKKIAFKKSKILWSRPLKIAMIPFSDPHLIFDQFLVPFVEFIKTHSPRATILRDDTPLKHLYGCAILTALSYTSMDLCNEGVTVRCYL